MPRYAVTIIYTAHVVHEVDAADIYEAQYAALQDAGVYDVQQDPDRGDGHTRRPYGSPVEPVTVNGRTVPLKLVSWYAGKASRDA